jgi:hypothetical protein
VSTLHERPSGLHNRYPGHLANATSKCPFLVAQLEDLVKETSKSGGSNGSSEAGSLSPVSVDDYSMPRSAASGLGSLGTSLLDGLLVDYHLSHPSMHDNFMHSGDEDYDHLLQVDMIDEL